MRSQLLPPACSIARLEELERAAIPVIRTGAVPSWTVGGRRVEVPLAWLDCRGRPDVADLARAHRLEGAGDHRARWDFALGHLGGQPTAKAILTLRLKRPVRCHLRLVFDLVADRRFLERAATVGAVLLTHLPPPSGSVAVSDVVDQAMRGGVPAGDLVEALAFTEAAAVRLAS